MGIWEFFLFFDVVYDDDLMKQCEYEYNLMIEKELEYKKYMDTARKVYTKCVELNIDLNKDIDKIDIIANSFGVKENVVKKCIMMWEKKKFETQGIVQTLIDSNLNYNNRQSKKLLIRVFFYRCFIS